MKVLFILTFILCSDICATHKIIYFISPPRSLSVAFMRMIQERGDFAIFHEPSLNPFYKSLPSTPLGVGFTDNCAATTTKVVKRAFKQARTKNVFIKEMSFAADLLLTENGKFLTNKNVYFVFLVRNPHHSIISLYNKRSSIFHAHNPVYCGYEALSSCFKKVSSQAARKPYLILTEDLYNTPDQTIKDFCAYLDIPYKPEALHWQELDSVVNAQDEWHEVKTLKNAQHWHSEAIKSKGFDKPKQYKLKNGVPTFEEITNDLHKAFVEAAYHENLKHYNELLKNYRLLNA